MTAASEPDANPPKMHREAVRVLVDYILKSGLQTEPLPREYFYASLPLCVIDAVFSIGVTYTSTRNTVIRFCDRQGWAIGPAEHRAHGEKTLSDLLDCYAGLSSEEAADQLFGNRQRTKSANVIHYWLY